MRASWGTSTSRCATTRSGCATASSRSSGRRSTRSTSAWRRSAILKGIEVNIRANGELDVDDDVLAQLDWVIASVHTSFDKDPTGRVLQAMESPHVDCIGHLTSRKIGKRGPSGIEVEKVVERALETGTFLEINSQPDRLDLRDAHARLAGEAGLTLVVSTRRPPARRARLRRARHRAGAARVADEGADPQHAPVVGDREAEEVSFREDGAAAVGWVADYLERVRDLPVLAQVEPGELRARLPASPPEQAEPFDAILRDLDDVLMPALTHWQSPRFFAYFANTGLGAGHPRRAADRGPQPDRHSLAHLAGSTGAGGGDARLARAAARPTARASTATSRTPPRPAP